MKQGYGWWGYHTQNVHIQMWIHDNIESQPIFQNIISQAILNALLDILSKEIMSLQYSDIIFIFGDFYHNHLV